MSEESGTGVVGVGFVDMNLMATEWWREDRKRLLPGEAGGATVFVVEFQDGCCYFGYTGRSVVARLGELLGGSYDWGSDDFMTRHSKEMPYVVRCVASNLDRYQARSLRNLLVSMAPRDDYEGKSTAAVSSRCWLREGDSDGAGDVEVMTFAEWFEPSRSTGK